MTWHMIIRIGCDPRWAEEEDSVFDFVHLVLRLYYYRISPAFFDRNRNGPDDRPIRHHADVRQGTLL